MLAFSNDAEAGLLKRTDGMEVVDAGDLSHALDGNLDLPHVAVADHLVARGEVLPNRIGDVFHGFRLGGAL